MVIELHRPTRIRLRRGRAARHPGVGPASVAVGSAIRLVLVGMAIGIFLMTGSGIASIAFVGVIALGAALTSWDR
jgi:hypothetical protein